MSQTYRIGSQLTSGDPFWVLVHEAVYQRASQLDVSLIPLEFDLTPLAPDEQVGILEELLAQNLDALIAHGMDDALARLILDAGVPLIVATETDLHHPRTTSPRSLYEVASIGARYLAERLGSQGRVLVVGGLCEGFDKGESRLDACRNVLQSYPGISLIHLPAPWTYALAYEAVRAGLREIAPPCDGIFGLSDSLALAGRDAARAAGVITDATVVVGINGDPLALAAIIEGTMAATVETPAAELGRQLIELAYQAAAGEPLPVHFSYRPRLVTRQNAAEIAAQKLITSATVPGRLVGFSREQEAQRLKQLETSLTISQRVDSILDRQQLSHDIAEIIRANYGYDRVRIYLWSENDQVFILDAPGAWGSPPSRIPLAESGLLGETLRRDQPTFIPDMQRTHRFPPDPRLPDCRSRVILPIRFGQQVLGLLDLQSAHSTQHSHIDLVGLEVLGDQLGIAMRNAELYGEAIAAQDEATRASQLKSRLLANVSHELRAPLNIIQGYSQLALASPNPYDTDLPPALLRDLRHLSQSSEHLGRLINDLLDLSRAEINDLDIFPEPVAPNTFLADVFQAMSESQPPRAGVAWRLELPETLPEIRVDPLRLRQILFNLLSNAHKFTERGHITLGALASATHLHLWVDDTGRGIPLLLQQHIFRAFITAERPRRPAEGLGLGLRITHELVKLHGGTITFTSLPGTGATFHVYLPLPEPESRAERLMQAPVSALPDEANLPPYVNDLTRQTVSYLKQNYADESLSRAEIAAHVAVSESYLTRMFRRDLGIVPWEYLTRYRIEQAKTLLRVTNLTVTEIAYQIGYNDCAFFSRVFHQETGRSPLTFRRQVR
jgi:signal transduction histidine kinase/ABC-type sugar transport system substrate-binding protein/AraC-like DNA-binding protein